MPHFETMSELDALLAYCEDTQKQINILRECYPQDQDLQLRMDREQTKLDKSVRETRLMQMYVASMN